MHESHDVVVSIVCYFQICFNMSSINQIRSSLVNRFEFQGLAEVKSLFLPPTFMIISRNEYSPDSGSCWIVIDTVVNLSIYSGTFKMPAVNASNISVNHMLA